ncbi:hypothetical protein GJ744_003824 [Endocarpon pusillum]|uniref:Uncharacterized protein n=1 Tax=Endocarpon pusillum TaxID=364733 RepID=A0A8H7E9F1_9EURO|nr:hypothetical protein GJ744_003824 [Endocarpon pusillum]
MAKLLQRPMRDESRRLITLDCLAGEESTMGQETDCTAGVESDKHESEHTMSTSASEIESLASD